jgi:ActR/RegA family two-component response regulator
MKQPIVLIVDDLMFAPRLEALVGQAGYEPLYATDETALTQAMVQAPALCIVDLFASTFDWERLVRFIKGPAKKNDHVPVLGFGPHVDLVLREQALKAGCTTVVGRSAIVTNLPALIEKNIWRVDPEVCAKPLPPLVWRGIEEFNQGLYFECHETLEDAWNEEGGTVRILYQGILQIGVGYLHITRQNWRGAVKVLERGIPKTARFRPTCQGIDVTDVVAQAQAVRAKILELGPDRIGEFDTSKFPKIKVNGEFPGVEGKG